MLTVLFVIFAVAGGTVMLCQFALTLLGMGGDGGHGIGHDFHDMGPADDDASLAGHEGAIDHQAADDSDAHHSTWLFGVISFRTIVAAATFFGLAGLAAESAGMGRPMQLVLSLASGAGAMYGVSWLMRQLARLGEDDTIRIQRAVGQDATVYIPIDPLKSRAGKVQLKLQNRLVEYEAITSADERLATGTKVRVVGLSGNVLEVAPVAEKVA
jgi:membrane protein implicated in regulation of membrane protease activity